MSSNVASVTNFDLFEELFNMIKKETTTINDVVKEFGGSNYYIPSWKSIARNDEIIKEYKESRGKVKNITKTLARKYELSEAQIYAITKDVREPTLFT